MKRTSDLLMAKKDIKVHKLFSKRDFETKLHTPFYDMLIDEVFTRGAFLSGTGGYCSYPNKKTAIKLRKDLKEFDSSLWSIIEVVECFIPQGTSYYKGVDENCSKSTNGMRSLQSAYLKRKIS
jgi:hypothetical protein